ncbi:MAG TPA: hypothetical protein VHO71_01310, partial [Caproiciproducens sp.]|nr:hypothetical protein [Caproiciproducens sp.]
MKAVIVEIRENHAAALSDDGCVIKVKDKNYAIGQVIEMKKTTRLSAKFVVWAASAAAAVVILGTGAWAYYTPYTYVSLDVNPSIEYSVNRFDRVLSAVAVNNDGKKILESLALQNKPIEEAVKDTVKEIKKNGYFQGTDPGAIEISTASENEQNSELLAQNLETTAKEETVGSTAPVEVDAVSVGLARVQEARTLGTTPGKLNLVQKLQASSSSPDGINVEEWLKKPVKDIMKAIKQNKKEAKGTVSDADDIQEESSASGTESGEISQSSNAISSSDASSFTQSEIASSKKGHGKSKASSTSSQISSRTDSGSEPVDSETGDSSGEISHNGKP